MAHHSDRQTDGSGRIRDGVARPFGEIAAAVVAHLAASRRPARFAGRA